MSYLLRSHFGQWFLESCTNWEFIGSSKESKIILQETQFDHLLCFISFSSYWKLYTKNVSLAKKLWSC